MANLILNCGQKVNILERMASPPVANPAASANFPPSNLYAPAASSSLFLFGSVAASPTVTFDKQGIFNGSFDSALSASDWVDISVGAGNSFTRVTSTPTPQAGSGCGKATCATTGGANQSAGRQYIYVRAGEKRTLGAFIQVDNVARTGRIEVYNPHTGHYLKNDGTWQASQIDVFSSAVASWTAGGIVGYTVESQAVSNADLIPLRITCYATAAAGWAAFDEVYDWPWDDGIMLDGWLNLEPVAPVEIHSSTNNFGGNDTTRATPTMPDNPYMNPAFYALYTSHGDRWLRVKLNGTPSGIPYAPYGGSVVAFQRVISSRVMDYGWSTDWLWAQARSSVRSYLLEDAAVRTLQLTFKYPLATSFVEARDALFGRSALGHYPMLVIPSDIEDAVVWGRIDPMSWAVTRMLNSQYNLGTVKVIELPHPTVTNV